MLSDGGARRKVGYQGLIHKCYHLRPERRRWHNYTELEVMAEPPNQFLLIQHPQIVIIQSLSHSRGSARRNSVE